MGGGVGCGSNMSAAYIGQGYNEVAGVYEAMAAEFGLGNVIVGSNM